MNRFTVSAWLVLSAAVTAVLAFQRGDAHAAADKKPLKIDHSSPQAVTKSFKQAVGKRDWKGMFACMTKDFHNAMTTGLMFAGSLSTFGDKTKVESFEDLLIKYGLDPNAKQRFNGGQTDGMKNQAALFGDLVEWLEKNGPKPLGGKTRKSIIQQLGSVEMKNFKIDGDKATADVIKDGKKTGQPADFRKIGGKWYLHFEMTKPKRTPKTDGG